MGSPEGSVPERICPVCSQPAYEDASEDGRDGGQFCSPERCSAWKTTGETSITGARLMVRAVEYVDA